VISILSAPATLLPSATWIEIETGRREHGQDIRDHSETKWNSIIIRKESILDVCTIQGRYIHSLNYLCIKIYIYEDLSILINLFLFSIEREKNVIFKRYFDLWSRDEFRCGRQEQYCGSPFSAF